MDDKTKQARENLEQIRQVNQAGAKIQEDLSKQAPISTTETQQLLQDDRRLDNLEWQASANGSNQNFQQQNIPSRHSSQGATHPNQDSKKPKAWLIGIMVVVILGIVGGVIALVAINNNQDEQKPSTPEIDTPIVDEEATKPKDDANTNTEASVQEIVDAIQVALDGYFNKDESMLEFSTDDFATPYYQSDHMIVGTSLDRAIGFTTNSFLSSDDPRFDTYFDMMRSDDFINLINKTFEERGFVSYGEDITPVGEYISNEMGIVCTGISQGLPIYFGCGSTSWLTSEKANLVNALADAYNRAETGRKLAYVNANVSDIKDSEIEPYQRLQAQFLGGYGLFYRTSPESEWRYFAGGQAPLECSEYNTDDLRNAFAGNVCYNGSEESKVQP